MKKIIALTLVSVSLTIGLAGAAQAHRGRITNAPPALPASVRNAELSALMSKVAKLHVEGGTRLSARELSALGLTRVPGRMAARFTRLAKSTRARTATVGSTYWFTYQYYGHFWADVYYDGPFYDQYGEPFYNVFSNYKICDSQGANCIDLNTFTWITNIELQGTYYYINAAGGYVPDSYGLPVYGNGPQQDGPGGSGY